jgi:predicted secreted hydrolase
MMRRAAWIALLALAACSPPPSAPDEVLSVVTSLSAEPDPRFERALEPRAFSFPADHGPHPSFQIEWWYFTGNLTDVRGRRFGYQLTFFRSALEAERLERPSRWAASDAWMAHFALTDVEDGSFHAFERFERGALGLASAQAEPFAVWTGPWRADGAAGTTFPIRLRAEQGALAIDLALDPLAPGVLQGDRGLSQKGERRGNASYYYSFPRLETRGEIRTHDGTFEVSGTSWLDREWSTSALEPGQVGWDWVALQLDDARELMLYQIRRDDGTPGPQSAGTLIEADGTSRALALDAFTIDVLATWQSKKSGVVYPAHWRIRVPSASLDLDVRPALADQELDLTFRYWEGAVDVAGSHRGRGYVELVGYTRNP